MRLLVTGGAGYIGSVVVERLLERGDDVIVIDNLVTGHRRAVPAECTFVRGDIRDEEALARAMDSSTQAVLHFAASSIVAESVEKPLDYFDNNIGGALHLLKLMKKRGVNKIIFSSSAAVYGSPDKLPIEETAPCKPENPYGYTKLAVERILESCKNAWGLRYISLRYFNAAGSTSSCGEDHRPESHLLPIVLDVALGRRKNFQIYGSDYDTIDGTCVRDYIHVADLAEAHILALEALDKNFSGAMNLGSEKPHSVLEIIAAVEKVTGKSVPYDISGRRPGDPPALLASSKKAEELMGWQKRYSSLQEIISSAYRWRLKYPHGYNE
jgi:UDP-glucose 4-epimerase